MKCYICNANTTDPSGLCPACLQRTWQDHVRDYAGDIPASNIDHWEHKPDDIWYWSTKGYWETSITDPRFLPDFGGWDRPCEVAIPQSDEPLSVAELSHDLAQIIAAQVAEIARLRANLTLLERVVMEERTVPKTYCTN